MDSHVNKQEPLKPDRDVDGYIRVHSVFRTIQGEGPFSGRAALFIRMYGCNLQCPWCDTEYTKYKWRLTPHHIVKTVVPDLHDWPSGLIVITGGEPFRQNITPTVNMLLDSGYEVQIETNGTLYLKNFPWEHPNLTVVCSPKTGKIHPKTARAVHAYKYVLQDGQVAPDGLPERALGHPLAGTQATVARPPVGWNGPVYLQPMDAHDKYENRANLDAVMSSVATHPEQRYIASVQVHKLMRIP